MMNRTAVLHVRVSSQKQADKELPVESQLARCEALAERLEAKVLAIYQEEGVSGWQGPRHQFEAAIRFCEERRPDYFITWSTSRFSRNQGRAIDARERLERAGTKLIYVSFDPGEDANTRFLNIAIREVMDEFFSRETSSSTRRSMVHNAERGYFNGGRVPYGFEALPAPDNLKRRRLFPVAAEASIVRDIFRRRLEGEGALVISRALNAEGASNRGQRWTKQSVTNVLRGGAVAGVQVFGRRPRPSRVLVPREEWVVVKSHEPIISREEWERVQALMDDAYTTKGGQSAPSTHLFTGILFCGRCGASLQIETATGRSGKLYSYYNCRNAQKKDSCENRRLRADELDEFLISHVTKRIFSRRNVLQLIKDMRESIGKFSSEKRKRLDDLDAEIADHERKLRKLLSVIEGDDLRDADTKWLVTTGSKHQTRIDHLQGERERVESTPDPHLDLTEDDVEQLRALLIDVVSEPKYPKKIRMFLRQVLERIVITDKTAQVYYHPSVILSAAPGFAEGLDTPRDRFASSASRLPDSVTQLNENSGIDETWLPDLTELRTKRVVVPLPAKWHRKAA